VVPQAEEADHLHHSLGRNQPGKSDPIDAEAVALAALRHPDLPVAELDGPTREVELLVDHRRDLVGQRTRVANRLRWHLHELDPALEVPSRGLRRYRSWTTSPRGWRDRRGWWPGWPGSWWPAAAS
jgi:transposase